MSHDDEFVHGIIASNDSKPSLGLDVLAHDILDDVLHNLIHDIVLGVHREEKILRANSAAIFIEQFAERYPEEGYEGPQKDKTKSPVWKTEAAIKSSNGEINIIGNPLETQKEILCPKCHLPRWIDPPIAGEPARLSSVIHYMTVTDGGRPRETTPPPKKYCPYRPAVNIPGLDVHGVPFPRTDVRGKNRKQANKKDNFPFHSNQNQEINSSFESSGPPTPPEEAEKKKKPPKKESYPEVICKRCGYRCAVNIYGRHLSKCMGIGGRASGRAAALKMNGEANGSRGTSTPPASRKSTPIPPYQTSKKSPSKRAASSFGEDDEDQYEEVAPKKKKRRRPAGKNPVLGMDAKDGTVGSSPTPKPVLKLKFKIKKLEVSSESETTIRAEPKPKMIGESIVKEEENVKIEPNMKIEEKDCNETLGRTPPDLPDENLVSKS